MTNNLVGWPEGRLFLTPEGEAEWGFESEKTKIHIADRGQAAAPKSATIKNDPSAGSPTETLLRLLVPPVDQVYQSSPLKATGCPVNLLQLQLIH